MQIDTNTKTNLTFQDFKDQVINDYTLAFTSRECSLIGRREVLTGKAKFGIFGDGKELPQLAMARVFKNGDFRSGYYRDQTFMMAINRLELKQFFAGLYAHTDIEKEPMSAGRQMGGHFVTKSNHPDGSWLDLTKQKNSSADISTTSGQMPRLLGLAQASKVYRELKDIDSTGFSINGNEVAWGTIGNASTSEGLFFETFNAAGVMQVPMVVSVWDDEYGISVPNKYQTTKESISEVLKGFQRDENNKGFEVMVVKGWDYPALIETYEKANKVARNEHVPVLIHVIELTQPLGHSTSGSHERYKSKERLEWERKFDCNLKMREWIIQNGFAVEEELIDIEKNIKKEILKSKKEAWVDFLKPFLAEKKQVVSLLDSLANSSVNKVFINQLKEKLITTEEPGKHHLLAATRKAMRYVIDENSPEKIKLKLWIDNYFKKVQPLYSSHLFSETEMRATNIKPIAPEYDNEAKMVDGRIVLRDNFDKLFHKHPKMLVFGEDTGKIGDVNQGLEGLQKKHGEVRIADTGIREGSIIGQGIGMALRGLRPIAEIQYVDYVLYCLNTLSDDLASLLYRTVGQQKAPLIIRTRGHRLEGIWHAGSPMSGLMNYLRGICILVPRNMTIAAGFYNTLMESDDPALVVESLNGYRLKEKMPSNLGDFKVAIGVIEVVKEGSDITLVSYGSTLRIVEQAARELQEVDIDAEIIDAQSLMPFDINHESVKSVKKTSRLLVIDEDVPGGASAYLLQEIIETQGGYKYLDSAPQTLAAKPHRPAYSSDGDYFSKPNAEDIFEKVYSIMHESNPHKYPKLR